MNNKIALFPGSFDPITLGHIDVIKNALQIFDKIIIAIGINENKNYMWEIEARKNHIQSIFEKYDNIIIKEYHGLTVEYCKSHNITHIIRGLRNTSDFNYEQTIAYANKRLNSNIQTIFIPSKQELSHISSSVVKEIIKNKGDLKSFLPLEVIQNI